MGGDRYAAAALRGWREVEGVASDRSDPVDPAVSGARRGRGTTLALDLEGGSAELSIASDGTMRLRAAGGAVLPLPPECAAERAAWRPLAASPRELANGGIALVSTHTSLRVEVERKPFVVRLVDRHGTPVAEICELAFASNGAARVAVASAIGERFFGFGDAPGPLDKRGQRLLLRNRDPQTAGRREPLRVSIPFFLVHRDGAAPGGCCGVLLDSFAPVHCDVAATREDRVLLEVASGGIDLMVFPGPEPRHVMARFTGRVGRTQLPPLWALGHHQSRRSYASARAIRVLAREIRRRGIPSDVIHLDVAHRDAGRLFSWSPKRFPDPARLLADLRSQGLRAVSAVDAGVKIDPEWEVYRDGCARDVFCKCGDGSPLALPTRSGDRLLPDFNRSEARAWWSEGLGALLEDGVAGISICAIRTSRWRSAARKVMRRRSCDPARAVQADPAEPKGSVGQEQVRNLYELQHARATRAALESIDRERRAFVVTRSGTTGIQRYAAVSAGENDSRWAHLRRSVPELLGLSLSGAAFCGVDIGGFFRSCTPELFARWIQLGALYPFARTHGARAARRQEPWRFGRRVQRIAHEALALRMRLLPYLYGLFREAEETGAPIWRPLCWEFPEDASAAEVEDQLLLGPSLLVAPVLERGARERSVYLPPGSWTCWHDDARYTGPRRMASAAPLDRLPLFVRAGSVIPMQSAVSHVEKTALEPCILAVYPGADASGALVEDDGETTAYRGGVCARTSLRLWSRAGGRLRLEIGRREGPFRISERPLRVEVHGCPPPVAVYLDGARLLEQTDAPGWMVRDGRLTVRLMDTGAGASIEIDPAP
jgi:alpha-glucosidase